MATAMKPTTGQFDLPGIQIIEPTLEHYLSPDKMTFSPFLGYIYKNCKNIVNSFPENTDPTKLKYDDWTKAAALVKPEKPEKSKKVVCSYPITTMWSYVLGDFGDMLCHNKICQTDDLVSRLQVQWKLYLLPVCIL